jgi:hypothetical protein
MSHIAGDGHTYYQLYNALMNFRPNMLPASSSSSVPNVEENNETVSTSMDDHVEKSNENDQIYIPTKSDQVCTDPDPTIPIMSVERVPEFFDDIKHAMGNRHDSILSVSFSLIIPSAVSMIYGKIRNLCSPTNQYQIQRRYIRIDQDKINIMKQEAVVRFNGSTRNDINNSRSETPEQAITPNNTTTGNSKTQGPPTFCSLNDVVTSWLMTNSKCQHGFMAMNMRSRKLNQQSTTNVTTAGSNLEDKVEIYPDTLAGNYISLLYYQIPKNCNTPMLIRQSLSNLRRVELPSTVSAPSKTPRNITSTDSTITATPKAAPLLLCGGSIVVSNWSSFRTTNQPSLSSGLPLTTAATTSTLDVIQEEVHHPLYTYQADKHPYNTILAIVYLENNSNNSNSITGRGMNQIGLMLCGSPYILDSLIQSCPFVGSTSMA